MHGGGASERAKMSLWFRDATQYLESKFHDRSLCFAHAGGGRCIWGLDRVDQGLVRVKALLKPAELLVWSEWSGWSE
jgi:hypothetical protein